MKHPSLSGHKIPVRGKSCISASLAINHPFPCLVFSLILSYLAASTGRVDLLRKVLAKLLHLTFSPESLISFWVPSFFVICWTENLSISAFPSFLVTLSVLSYQPALPPPRPFIPPSPTPLHPSPHSFLLSHSSHLSFIFFLEYTLTYFASLSLPTSYVHSFNVCFPFHKVLTQTITLSSSTF